jgi:phospholipase D1/2
VNDDQITDFMRPAPVPNEDETALPEDALVADPLSDEFLLLWHRTAINNKAIFTELFRTVPSNLVYKWDSFKDFVPKVKVGHLIPEISAEVAKERLSEVIDSLTYAALTNLSTG